MFSKRAPTCGASIQAGLPRNAKTRVLYFQDQGGLSFTAPEAKDEAFDEYVSDPNRPVPFIGYTALRVPQEYMVADQRFASTRPDVLVYQTEPLEQDVTIAGPVSPRLFVSTTGTDSDFVVKIIDVYPPDYPQPETKGAPATPPQLDRCSASLHHPGGIPAIAARLAHARQVP